MNRTTAGRATGAVLEAALAVVVALVWLQACQPPSPPPERRVPSVWVHVAGRAEATRELRLSGTLEPERTIPCSFSLPGTVEDVLVREGDTVQSGQVLARLAGRSYEDALGISKAKAAQAEDAWRRLEPMYRNHTLPEIKMVEVEAGRTQARLSVSMARKNLEDTVLKAPAAGIVSKRRVEPGENVLPGATVVSLVQTSTLLATVPVPEIHVARVAVGDRAVVDVPALGRSLDGSVREIAVVSDPLTRTYEVKVAAVNPDAALRVGMVVRVRLRIIEGPPALVVPPEALRIDETGASFVFVVGADQILVRRPVTIERYVGEGVAIDSGLADGESVVISGTPMLAEGMTVRVVPAPGSAEQP